MNNSSPRTEECLMWACHPHHPSLRSGAKIHKPCQRLIQHPRLASTRVQFYTFSLGMAGNLSVPEMGRHSSGPFFRELLRDQNEPERGNWKQCLKGMHYHNHFTFPCHSCSWLHILPHPTPHHPSYPGQKPHFPGSITLNGAIFFIMSPRYYCPSR